MIKKILKISLKLFLILVIPVYMGYHYIAEKIYQANLPMAEVIGPDEDTVMADAIAMATDMINKTRNGLTTEGFISGDATQSGTKYDDFHFGAPPPPETTKGRKGPVTYRRDVHIKSHGCVQADFIVPELDDNYRWGVLGKPHTFKAWIRYSNGDYVLNPDKKWDARGMAIKLMDVDGPKLLPGQQEAETQDFVMMNSTNYFIRHLEDYVELTKYLAVGDNTGYFFNGFNPFSWRWREFRLVAGTKKSAPETPLNTQYFSASAYKLGPDNYIKFSAKPAQCLDDNGKAMKGKTGSWETPRDDYNFLRLRMSEQLEAGPVCFDFMVQMQVPGKIMPVEDATVVWSEKDSPFVKVAQIKIPKTSKQRPADNEDWQPPFDTEPNREFCEDLSFNPWHSLAEHRPVGVFNRVRKALYQEIAKYRWDANRRQYKDPDAPALAPLIDGQPPEPNLDSLKISEKSTGL